MKRTLLIGFTLAAVLATGCGSKQGDRAGSQTPAAGGVRDLHSIGELRAAFDARRDQPRLILLISPT